MMAVYLSWYMNSGAKKQHLTVLELVLFAMLGALTFALKWAMSWMPNIEPVSLMVMLFGVIFGWKALYPIYLYVGLEILFYGLGTWNICYLYVWAILLVAAILLRKVQFPLVWALVSAAFGLFFGALCGIVDVFLFGLPYAVTKWASGIPYDVAHCVGNFVIALILFLPLRRLMEKLYAKLTRKNA